MKEFILAASKISAGQMPGKFLKENTFTCAARLDKSLSSNTVLLGKTDLILNSLQFKHYPSEARNSLLTCLSTIRSSLRILISKGGHLFKGEKGQ
jgi:hypothetical protein